MSPQFVHNELFKPFASTKEGGFGVGAFEARTLITAMGGRIDVQSREQEGSTFRIFLPIARDMINLSTDTEARAA
jgi:signal transduction histidine kinase